MVKRKIKMINSTGLHLRPAGLFCNTAIEFKSSIELHFNNKVYNAKSVLSVLSACVKLGDEIELVCVGDDEKEALKELTELIESGFGEM